jgi:hypothetical protein
MPADDDLFALFYEPLQRAVRQQNSNSAINYLDDERGLAASWSEALQKA